MRKSVNDCVTMDDTGGAVLINGTRGFSCYVQIAGCNGGFIF